MWRDDRGSTLSYEVDERLVLRRLGPGWDDFAIQNGAPELVSPFPLGRPLWMFMDDATTVQLYELLFARVSRLRRAMTVPVRCDGAARRRFFALTIEPGPSGGFSISALLVRSEPRQPIRLFDRNARRRQESIAMCSMCQRLEVAGGWMEVEDAVTLLRLFERDDMPRLTHTVCESCERFMMTLLKDDAKLPPA
jgi:hypothetical protein